MANFIVSHKFMKKDINTQKFNYAAKKDSQMFKDVFLMNKNECQARNRNSNLKRRRRHEIHFTQKCISAALSERTGNFRATTGLGAAIPARSCPREPAPSELETSFKTHGAPPPPLPAGSRHLPGVTWEGTVCCRSCDTGQGRSWEAWSLQAHHAVGTWEVLGER